MSASGVHVRALGPDEWENLREMRLFALRTEPGVFLSTYDKEAALAAEEWRATLSLDDGRVFGLFEDARLIGITGVFTWKHDPSRKTAVFAMSYILPQYRHRGFSRLMYEARLEWVDAQPQFEKIVVSHREGNEISAKANRPFGFEFVRTEMKSWPDGTTGNELVYEKRLRC